MNEKSAKTFNLRGRWFGTVGCGLAGGAFLTIFYLVPPEWLTGLSTLMGLATALLFAGIVREGAPANRITANIERDLRGNPKLFTLNLGKETVGLEPGKQWNQVDQFKWVTRGLIEGPQSFQVLPDGTVVINGEKIHPNDPDGPAKLEVEINKRHAATAEHKQPKVLPTARAAAAQAQYGDKVHFHVKLDHLGHMMIECQRGRDKTEIGLRGIPGLIQNGFMLSPKIFHLGPLLAYLELDGVRFECNAEGARQLEEKLNAKYAPSLKGQQDYAIEIRENPAAATGFDIHFITVRAGAKFEVKGHLTQVNLDLLNDPAKCDLLQPGIVVRLSPPSLIIRRKRPDSGEEKLPEFPDVQYRRINAAQLQQILNHPLIRRARAGAAAHPEVTEGPPTDIVELRVTHNPQSKLGLWLECVTAHGGAPVGRAFTHHNITDFQQAGVFLPHLDVALSLDHRMLSILNSQTNQEGRITVDSQSSEDELRQASRMLTAALKPLAPQTSKVEEKNEAELPPAEVSSPADILLKSTPPLESAPTAAVAAPIPVEERKAAPPPVASPANQARENPPEELLEHDAPVRSTPAPSASIPPKPAQAIMVSSSTLNADPPRSAPAEPPLDPVVVALFNETDPLRVATEIFRGLAARFVLPVQDVRLSLPRVFDDRRFEILSFDQLQIENVFQLRSADFYGFYLSHLSEHKIDLVYACRGEHIEWATNKCVLQLSLSTEVQEFKGHALRGLAQNRLDHFVFIVEPAYKEWVRPHEHQCATAFAHFITLKEFAATPTAYTLIWPELTPPSAVEPLPNPGT